MFALLAVWRPLFGCHSCQRRNVTEMHKDAHQLSLSTSTSHRSHLPLRRVCVGKGVCVGVGKGVFVRVCVTVSVCVFERVCVCTGVCV